MHSAFCLRFDPAEGFVFTDCLCTTWRGVAFEHLLNLKRLECNSSILVESNFWVVQFVTLCGIMQNGPAPPFFLSNPGSPPLKWAKWKIVFERYSKICGTSLSAESRTALVLHCLEPEGQDVFDHLPDLPDSEAANLSE